jgi:hypothetical protein
MTENQNKSVDKPKILIQPRLLALKPRLAHRAYLNSESEAERSVPSERLMLQKPQATNVDCDNLG